jgi:hypothetical protein
MVLFAAHHRKLIGNIDQLAQQAEADVLHTPELLTYLWEYLAGNISPVRAARV